MKPKAEKFVDLESTESTFLFDSESDASLGSKKSPDGVSVPYAAVMFTMSIAGAGVLGISGAIAQSGGFISIGMLLLIAVLNKRSYDLLIALSLDTEGVNGSYEQLGAVACGWVGRVLVFIAKFTYTFFTLVVHTKVVKDNFPSALRGIMGHNNQFLYLFESDDLVTFFVSLIVILPLMAARDMSVVRKTSVLKLCTVLGISCIIVYMYFAHPGPNIPLQGTSFAADWIYVYPGIFASIGTFVFFFVGHHCVHLGYESLRSDVRDMRHFRMVSTLSVCICIFLGICMGFTVYFTFWRTTTSIMLQLYPNCIEVNVAKLLVCGFVIFTLPLPFFACREMLILCIPSSSSSAPSSMPPPSPLKTLDSPTTKPKGPKLDWWLLEEKQLIPSLHFGLTILIWAIMTVLAILAPSLNDILNLGGCASGSLIAYILPAMFYLQLRGYSREAVGMLAFGLAVGTVGTYFAMTTMIRHIMEGHA